DTTQDRVNASAHHLDWMRDVQFEIRRRIAAREVSGTAYPTTDNFVAEAEVLLARAGSGPAPDAVPLEAATAYAASADVVSNWYWERIEQAHEAITAKLPDPTVRLRTMPYIPDACEWAQRKMEAEWVLNSKWAKRLIAAQTYRDRVAELAKVAK